MRHALQKGVAVALAAMWMGLASPAGAQPAPWFWWVSKLDSAQRVCAQVMPSKGWSKAEGPFDNAQCHSARRSLIQGARTAAAAAGAPQAAPRGVFARQAP